MKPVNILIATILAPVALIPIFIALVYLYAWGPIFFLRLTPYEIEQRRITFPQWIDNDEICYLELVLHRDKTVFEQGKFIFFIKKPIMDIYIYREKVGQPQRKRLIKHIARVQIQPSQSLEGSLDTDLGFRVYDNGKKIFLYYKQLYYRTFKSDYTYITLGVTGRNLKERIPKIASFEVFDISQDGGKLYGVIEAGERHHDRYYIAEYMIRDGKINKLVEITEGKFERSRRADIKDLKLLSKDKLVLSYRTDGSMPNSAHYIYLIDITDGTTELVEKLSDFVEYFDSIPDYLKRGDYVFEPNFGYVFSKDEKYIIAGNVGIYERKENGWMKVINFYKEYPSISPDGRRVIFIDLLATKGELNWTFFAGRKLAIVNFEELLKSRESVNIK